MNGCPPIATSYAVSVLNQMLEGKVGWPTFNGISSVISLPEIIDSY